MLKLVIILFSINLVFTQLIEAPENLLWPYPKQLNFNESNQNQLFLVPYDLKISIPNHERNTKLKQQFTEIFDFYNNKIFQNQINWIEYKTLNETQKFSTLILEIKNSSLSFPSFEANETYEIQITSLPLILLRAENYIGILRAVETFTQLIQYDKAKQLYFVSGLPLNIYDFPDYNYRSIMVDTSRHFIPKGDLLRTFDAMMINKLNVFHWHITDSQSFPMYMRRHPGLSEHGAYQPELVYTISDIKEIVQYAQIRGIRVVPEIDTPGHLESWRKDPKIQDIFVQSCQIIDITKTRTYEVIKDILLDLDEYFPDLYVHMGGDEVSSYCWQSKEIKDFLVKENYTQQSLYQAYFQKKQKDILLNINSDKQAIYWIIGNEPEEQFTPPDILQFWGSQTSYQTIIQKFPNNRLILSPISVLYFNCGFGTCGGFVSWQNMYERFTPLLNTKIKNNEGINKNVIGAEACLWSEQNNQFTLDQRLWIRGSTLAEILWNVEVKDQQNMSQIVKRLVRMQRKLINCGLDVLPISTEYCEMNIDECFKGK